jgi:hypothetical protein
MRMHAQTAMIEKGFVHLPNQAPWLAEYVHELTTFPKGKYDDQVDSTAQMLDWFKEASREPSGIYQYYKMLTAELRQQQRRLERRVRLKAPAGIGSVRMFSGIHRNVEPDGTVEMSESGAEPLLRAGWVRVGSPEERGSVVPTRLPAAAGSPKSTREKRNSCTSVIRCHTM